MYVRGISETEKKIAIFENISSLEVKICTENGVSIISYEEFKNIRSNPKSSEFLLVKKKPDKNIEDQYDSFIIRANEIRKLTRGKINLFKTGSDAKTVLKLFASYKPPQAEKILDYEATILEYCKNGPLRFGKPYKGIAYKADFVSEYPSILRSDHMQFPYKQGELKTLTLDEFNKLKYFTYGIYHIKIKNMDRRLMTENDTKDWYTHIDLNRAKELKYELELVEEEDNWLTYDGCLINGSKLFGKCIDYLFGFKVQKFEWAKELINPLWGALCQKNVLCVETIYKQDNVLSIQRNDTKYLTYNIIKSYDEYYETDWARIKPFLVAKGRYNISKVIEKNLENLVYTHTDGCVFSSPIIGVTFGCKIGDLKNEGQCEDATVLNSARCTGEFKIVK